VILLRRREGAAARFAAGGRPSRTTPWRQAGWCAVDLELTGLDPRADHIIAIGAVPIEEGRVVLGAARYTLVATKRRSDPEAVLTHKLRAKDLEDAMPVDDAIDLLLEVLTGRAPVFHTAAVERAFLGPLLRRRRLRMPTAADTEALGRLWLRERDGAAPAGISLARLARMLNQHAEPPHHALGDALTTAQAFISLASHLDSRSPQTVGSLIAAPDLLSGLRRMG
jgi:DNA polymerase III subunit epsilon